MLGDKGLPVASASFLSHEITVAVASLTFARSCAFNELVFRAWS
jgi:hypothetical protein